MSVNYYLVEEPCPHCGRGGTIEEGLPVGKDSSGWAFVFRAHPNIRSLADWRRVLLKAERTGERTLVDEHGREFPAEELLADARRKKPLKKMTEVDAQGNYLDPEGYVFADYEFS